MIECSTGPCDDALCCDAYCDYSMFGCDANYIRKNAPEAIRCGDTAVSCTNVLCCDATCGTHTCTPSVGWGTLPAAAGNRCGASSTDCTDGMCCAALCNNAASTCTAPNYKKIPSPELTQCGGGTTAECTTAVCCDLTCASHMCGPDTQPKGTAADIACVGGVCTDAQCCNVLCSEDDFKCGTGMVKKSDAGSIECGGSVGECTVPLCCDFTCQLKTCSAPLTDNTLNSDDRCGAALSTCTDQLCCLETCVSHTCPGDMLKKTTAPGIVCVEATPLLAGCSDTLCCDVTCTLYDCPTKDPGHVNLLPKAAQRCGADVATCTNAKCCVETCDTHTCQQGHRLKSTSGMIECSTGPCDDALCCDAYCDAAVFSCDDEHVLKTVAYALLCGATPASCTTSLCCDATCATLDCSAVPGYGVAPAALKTVCFGGPSACSPDTCCTVTCEHPTFACPPGTLPRPGVGSSVCGPSVAECAVDVCCWVETPSPPTPAPLTPAPPTSAPPTPAPPTAAPTTLAPPTPTPPTPAPPTVAPATIAPATPSPPTAAPLTAAPATEAPVTPAPSTAHPATSAPPTAAPTAVPVTVAPDTDAPDTAVPATVAPPTAAPDTVSPGSSQPSTQVADTDTPVVSTEAPATPVPQGAVTAAPPTLAPPQAPTFAPQQATPTFSPPSTPTFAPVAGVPTPVPAAGVSPAPPGPGHHTFTPHTSPVPQSTLSPDGRTVGVELSVARDFSSGQIHSDEGALIVLLPQGTGVLEADATQGPLGVRVQWGGEAVVHGSTSSGPCGDTPCLVVETDTSTTQSSHGIASTASAREFIAATASDGGRIELRLADPDFRAYASRPETVVVHFDARFYGGDVATSCTGTVLAPEVGNTAGSKVQMHCDCGVCRAKLSLAPEAWDLHSSAEAVQVDAAETGMSSVSGLAVVIGGLRPNTAGAMARLSIISRLCPEDGLVEVDRTINPLGLELGDRADMRQINGALVGSIAIQTFLLLVSAVVASVMYRKVSKKRMKHRDFMTCLPDEFLDGGSCRSEHELDDLFGGLGKRTENTKAFLKRSREARLHDADPDDSDVSDTKEEVRVVHQGLSKRDVVYLMARGRFGWILIPATFLYGGAALCSMSALMYSTPFFKFVAACDILVFIVGMSAYACWVGHQTKYHGIVAPVEGNDERNIFFKFLWGTSEWVGFERRGNAAWVELNHLLYDGYHHAARYFQTYELIISFLLGAIAAWRPQSLDGCWVKSSLTLGVLGVFFLTLVVLRPYLSPFENIMESLIAGTEVVITVFLMIAMQQEQPEQTWLAEWAGKLGLYVVYMIVLKASVDMFIFTIDEYGIWRELSAEQPPDRRVSFVRHLLCCGNNIKEDRLEDYVVDYEVADKEPLGGGASDMGDLHASQEDLAGASAETTPISSSGDEYCNIDGFCHTGTPLRAASSLPTAGYRPRRPSKGPRARASSTADVTEMPVVAPLPPLRAAAPAGDGPATPKTPARAQEVADASGTLEFNPDASRASLSLLQAASSQTWGPSRQPSSFGRGLRTTSNISNMKGRVTPVAQRPRRGSRSSACDDSIELGSTFGRGRLLPRSGSTHSVSDASSNPGSPLDATYVQV